MYSRIIMIFTIILFSFSILSSQVLSSKLVDKLNSANSDDYIRAVIRMKEHINISVINSLSIGKSKVEARSAVVSYIKTYAKESQNNIIEYLNQMKESDDIKYYHSIYSTNKIIIKARKSIIVI